MPKYRKKLIEVNLPLADINEESLREKMGQGRIGQLSALHQYWARRPIVACRAIAFAAMVDDPASYIDDPNEQAAERKRLHCIISQLAEWRNNNNQNLLAKAQLEIAKTVARSREEEPPSTPDDVLQYLAEHAPTIYDPFCGGGSIPLEAQRLGLKAVGSDLNPVAVLITKALIEIPPKFANKPPVNPNADPMGMTVRKGRKSQKLPWRGAAGLAADIRYYGRWMRDEAFKRIGHLYPTIKDENGIDRTVIAWLWCRTIPCANPACGINMPIKTTFQVKKPNDKHWNKAIVDRNARTVSFRVQNHEDGVPAQGTRIGNGVTCIACGNPIKLDYVREQAREGKMSEQMTAIVAEGDRKRLFISPTDEHVHAALDAKPDWKPYGNLPQQARSISIQIYGFTEWHQLFTDRQLKTITTFVDLLKDVRNQLESDGADTEYSNAIITFLALVISKLANGDSSFCIWDTRGQTVTTFTNQGIGMAWDFAEASPFSSAGKNWGGHLEGIAKLVEILPLNTNHGIAFQADASKPLSDQSQSTIITDPPYYDNIHFADSSDFFYVWLRSALRDIYPELLSSMLTPKEEEIVANRFRFENADQKFEEQLSCALESMNSIASSEFPSCIFYAYKQQSIVHEGTTSTGWEKMLSALIDSGFQITRTWPVISEVTKALKNNVNSLGSSIILVCRPRPKDAKSVTRQQFLDELADEMPKALDQLTQEGHIAPTDLAQSAIGPGMEIYSKYSSVTYISGKPFTVRDALMAINLEIQKYDERETGDLDAESQFCVTWLKQHGFDQGEYGAAETLSKAKNMDVDDLADTHDILTSENRKVQLHDIDYYHPPEHDPELPIDDRGGNMTAWEACFRIAYHLDNARRVDADDVRGAAPVFNTKGRDTERIERLARILYNYHDARGEAHLAYIFNSIVTRWNEIFVEANRLDTSHQQTLT